LKKEEYFAELFQLFSVFNENKRLKVFLGYLYKMKLFKVECLSVDLVMCLFVSFVVQKNKLG